MTIFRIIEVQFFGLSVVLKSPACAKLQNVGRNAKQDTPTVERVLNILQKKLWLKNRCIRLHAIGVEEILV